MAGSGFAEKDKVTGEPTGILRNCTRYVKVPPTGRQASDREKEARLKELFADYNSVGITSICDRDASLDGIERYESLRQKGELTVRISCSQGVGSIGPIEKIQSQIRSVARNPLHTEKDDWLRIIGIKTYLDGGMLTGSAYLREPWGVSEIYGITDPDYRGVLFIPRERLLAMVREAVAKRPAIHRSLRWGRRCPYTTRSLRRAGQGRSASARNALLHYALQLYESGGGRAGRATRSNAGCAARMALSR
jgi:predicted amidohydrolase YtcJ